MSELYSDADLRAFDETVDRFRLEALYPRCERPERPMTPADLAALRVQAARLGLLGEGREPETGVWEHAHDASARTLSVRVLRALGEVNAGFALHVHGLALGRLLARELGFDAERTTVPCLLGVWGLGRSALPRHLRGLPLDGEQRALLADYFACAQPRELLLHAGDDFERVLLPSYDAETDQLSFGSYDRGALQLRAAAGGHAPDETATFMLARSHHVLPAQHATPAHARALYAQALGLYALGLLAIAAGALAQAHAKARQYAALRVQGGVAIERHAAVQALLGSTTTVRSLSERALYSLAREAPGLEALPAFLSARAELHPRLCRASNDALQVFGGLGYMKDTGLEKLVRDQNALRVLCGAPAQLLRFVAEWERA